MGKTKAGKGKIVARVFLVIGILLSMTIPDTLFDLS